MAMTAEQIQSMVVGFNRATRSNTLQLPTATYTANSVSTIPLPQVGFLAKIGGVFEINVTTAATGTYANKTGRSKTGGRTPFDAVTAIRVTNQNSNQVYNTSAWGNYLWTRTLNEQYDVINPPTGTDVEAGVVWSLAAGNTANTAYTYRFPFQIPIALSPSLQSGLQLLQNNTTRYALEIQWGDIAANLLTLGGTTPSLGSITATVSPYVQYFNTPNLLPVQGYEYANYPDLSKTHVILEEITDITGTGDFIYRVPTGPEYLSIMQEFVNNGAYAGVSVVNNLRDVFSSNQQTRNVTSRQFILEQQEALGGAQLPGGVYYRNFKRNGSGLMTVADGRDVVRTDQITDYQLIANITAGTTLTGAFCRTIREFLTVSSFGG